MLYVNGHFIYGTQTVRFAETIINQNITENELLTQFVNWPDTCEYNVTVESIDGSYINMPEDNLYFKITGPIKDMLQFIYKYILNYGECSIEQILANTSELDMIMDIYLQKLW